MDIWMDLEMRLSDESNKNIVKIISFYSLFKGILTIDLLDKEWRDWNKLQNYVDADRFGQYICNKYLVRNRECPEIYFEESDDVAFWKISEAII